MTDAGNGRGRGQDESRSATVEGAPAETVARLREILQLLVRAQKALRMYQGVNPITLKLETELYDRLATLLERQGPLELRVRQHQLLFDEQPVYENRDRKESLAFLLFRDGLRSITLLPDLEADELRRFLGCLNRVRALVSGEDDLVTLFWEEDFRSIRYVALDELGDELGGDVAEQLSAGVLPGHHEGGGGGDGDAVRLDDVKPLSRLPIEAAHLTEEEVESLRREIAAEQALDLEALIPDLAVELAALEPGDEERRRLTADLLAVLDARLEGSDGEAVILTVNRLGELCRTTFADCEAAMGLQVAIREGLSSPQRLERFLAATRDAGGLHAGVQRLLARLPEGSHETLVRWLGRFPRAADRRALTEVLAARGERCLGAVGKELETLLEEGDRAALTEVLHLASQFPEAGLPLVERLLASTDAGVRRDAAVVLGRVPGEQAVRLWLDLLDHPDEGLRSLAIAALARSGPSSAAREIVERVVGEVPERSEEELRRALAVAGRLAGDAALSWLGPLLQPKRRRWFASRREQVLTRAAAHGIQVVGSTEAHRLLESLLHDGDRICRAACAAELGAGG